MFAYAQTPHLSPLAVAIDGVRSPVGRQELAAALGSLITAGLSGIPLPSHGNTIERWRTLAAIAAKDLSLVKIAEGHADAVAILAELDGPALPADALCGTWAAESKEPLRLEQVAGNIFLRGRKQWCSGAPMVTHALVTCWERDHPRLALVDMRQAAVTVSSEGWQAIGMANTQSVDVVFEDAVVQSVGKPGAYLLRPGFWQGGAGIAACWFGATRAIAEELRDFVARRPGPYGAAHLGQVDAELAMLRAGFRAAAAWIDANPQADAQQWALRLRTAAELLARRVMELASTALGAGAYCKNAVLAQKLADLPVYLSQSHAEKDWEALGQLAAQNDLSGDWAL